MRNFAFSWQRPSIKSEERCLILTLAAGSGHLQAAKAKKAQLAESSPELKVYTVDILVDWLGNFVGSFLTKRWNSAQRKGNLLSLAFYVLLQYLGDLLVWVPLFLAAVIYLSYYRINWIIDTQIMGMSPLIKAIRLIHFLSGRKIHYEKVVTDLPTAEATHFFAPIRRLSKKDREYIQLITTRPLLRDSCSEEEFWKKHCGLRKTQVRYEDFPLRPSFRKFAHLDQTLPLSLTFRLSNEREKALIEKSLKRGFLDWTSQTDRFNLTLLPSYQVSLLMLGGNPDRRSLIEYTKQFIEMSQKKQFQERKDVLFVFCNEAQKPFPSLLMKLTELIQQIPHFPASLTIVPLPFQNDDVIAPLLYRSNATLTRSGGLTSMELLAASHGKILIHRAHVSKNLSKLFAWCKTIQMGMPHWENGNAEYLKAKKGAEFVTPETFEEVCADYFTEVEELAPLVSI